MEIVNPLTNRPILRGGRTYRELTGPRGRFIEHNGLLVPRPVIRVALITNPSPPPNVEVRDYTEIAMTPVQVQAAIEAWETGEFDDPAALFRDEFYGEYTRRVVISFLGQTSVAMLPGTMDDLNQLGNIDFEIDDELVGGDSPPLFDDYVIGADQPRRLPFINVELNDGIDGRCVERWLGYQPENTSPASICAAMDALGVRCEIVDVFGKRIAATKRGILLPDSPRAVLYQAHVYPVTPNRIGKFMPVLPSEKRRTYAPCQIESIELLFSVHNAAFYMRDNKYYIGDTVFEPVVQMNSDQQEFVKEAYQHHAGDWSIDTMLTFKKAAMPLYKVDPAHNRLTRDDIVSFDANKCYFNVARAIFNSATRGESSRAGLFVPDMFCEPEPFDPFTVHECAMVGVDANLASTLQGAFGISSNVMMYGLWRVASEFWQELYRMALPPPVLMWNMRPQTTPINDKLWNTINARWALSAKAMKDYSVINGTMGKILQVQRTEFDLAPRYVEERLWYAREHGMSPVGGRMVKHKERPRLHNMFHWHLAVIQCANIAVLSTARDLYRTLGILPIRIKTDALQYYKAALTFSNHTTPAVILSTLEDIRHYGLTWKLEKAHDGAPDECRVPKSPPVFRFFEMLGPGSHPYLAEYQRRNRVHFGPPGSGKTTRIIDPPLELPEERCDYYATMTNRNARRITRKERGIVGQTIHSLLGIAFDGATEESMHPVWSKLRGRRIFIDEAQSVPRHMWRWFVVLFHRFNVSFTFAMDRNQLAPIDDNDTPITHNCAFLGQHFEHKLDWRNAPNLVAAREQVLNGTFVPSELLPGVFDPSRFTHVNIAAYVKTCEWVNEQYTRHMGITWGAPGSRYIVDYEGQMRLQDDKGHKRKIPKTLSKGTLLRIGENGQLLNHEDGSVISGVGFEQIEHIIKFAYCVTTDKMIGSTIREPMTVWDYGCRWFMQRWGLLYTAITRAVDLEQITFRERPAYDTLE